MADGDMETIRSYYQYTDNFYRVNGLYNSYQLSPIWKGSRFTIFKAITSAESIDQFLRALNSTSMTNIAIHGEKARRSIAWLQVYLNNVGRPIDSFGPEISESAHYPESACMTLGSRRVSSDFLWRLTLIERIERTIEFPKSKFFAFELGTGSASFMRVLKMIHSQMTGVLIDLPETLAIAHANLKSSFPNANILYMTDMDIEYNFSNYDFVLVPTAFREVISTLDYFIFINCNSLGEMPNFTMKYWMDFVQGTIKPEFGFFLNRFLNRIDPETMQYRTGENRASLLYDRDWELLDWEVDPPFERNPYSTWLTRNLLFISKRSDGPGYEKAHQMARALICEINQEDWYTKPYPELNTRGDREITPDLTKTGTLFKLWNAYRLAVTDETISALLKYLTVLGGMITPFEETFALKQDQIELEIK